MRFQKKMPCQGISYSSLGRGYEDPGAGHGLSLCLFSLEGVFDPREEEPFLVTLPVEVV